MSTKLPSSTGLCSLAPLAGASRYVGDPVDLITGALVDQETDFRLPGATVTFAWIRRYDSRHMAHDRGLGAGFRHALDHSLRFDSDGMTYVDASGRITYFSSPASDGDAVTEQTLQLERVSPRSFRLHEAEGRVLEFLFRGSEREARLVSVTDADGAYDLQYEGSTLSAIELGALGRVQLQWKDGHIARVCLTRDDSETELVAYRYDERGRLVDAKNAYKHSLRYDYDDQSRVIQKTDRRGFRFQYQYDALGRCIDSRAEDGAEGIKLEYRPIERTTVVTRHDGGKWTYQYTDSGAITNVLDPCGGAQAYVLDDLGRVCEEIDGLGNSTLVLYDALGLAYAKVDPLKHVIPLPEDPELPHPLEHQVADTALEREYGTLFAPPTRLPAGDTPLWELPVSVRNSVTTSDPEWGGQTRIVRNLQGLPLREERESGAPRRWAFDENANVRWEIDFDGSKSTFEYESGNHLAKRIDARGALTQYGHSPTEELTALTDPGGTRSEYVLDQKDRVVEIRRHGRLKERYAYDHGDNLIEKRDGRGELLLEMTYGAGNLMLSRRFASGETQNFDYDECGRLIAAFGEAGSCSFTYAPTGARQSDLRAEEGVEHSGTTLQGRTTTVLGRFVTRYSRGRNGELLVTDPTGRSHTLREISRGIYERSFSSGVRELSQYDVWGRCLLKALYSSRGDDTPWVRGYRLSGEGNLLALRDSQRGETRYHYDAAHHLQRVEHADRRVDSYEHDLAGNLLRMPNPFLEGRKLGEGVRFAVGDGNRLHGANGEQFHYNDRDSIVQRDRWSGTTHYVRDSLDQLIAISGPGLEWSAQYDALGRRTQKTVQGATTHYWWDGDRLIAERFPNGSVRVYVYASELALVPLMFVDYAQLDAELESGRRYYVASNHLGAVERVLNDAGEVVWRGELDPYGLTHVEAKYQRFYQPLRFPGHFYDAETGLHYNRFRYYDPSLGRYLESDPLGISGGENLYAYTDNPLRDVDVLGLRSKCPNSLECRVRKLLGLEGKPKGEGSKIQKHLMAVMRRAESRWRTKAQRTEARGEKDAALFMRKESKKKGGPFEGFQLAKGYSPGRGFDQVWVKKENGKITHVMIVEAKGRNQSDGTPAKLGKTKTMGDQMDSDWVDENAKLLSKKGKPAEDQKLGKAIQDGMESGDPKVSGVVVTGGNKSTGHETSAGPVTTY